MARKKMFPNELPPLRVTRAIYIALKKRSKATRLPEAELRRMALERLLIDVPAPAPADGQQQEE